MAQRATFVFEAVLRKAIRKSGRSINSIAQRSGISQPVLSRFVNGHKGINDDTAELLSEELGVEKPEGSDAYNAEVLLKAIDHHQAAVEFINKELPYVDEPEVVQELEEHLAKARNEIQRLKKGLREIFPEYADDEDD